DGFTDVYIANGHETNQSARDYEPQFWLHDIYAGNSRDDVATSAYFMAKFGRTRGRGWSYGGYEKNRLYLNQRGHSFVEAGHLMGVALEEDSRAVVTDDLDGDGRMDLLVTTFETWPQPKQTLRVFKNTLEDGGNWIGIRLQQHKGSVSPIGARVTLRYPGGTSVQPIVTGDSYRSQQANTVDFGLGNVERVDSIEIKWTNGQTRTLREPLVNRYHAVGPPDESPVQRGRAACLHSLRCNGRSLRSRSSRSICSSCKSPPASIKTAARLRATVPGPPAFQVCRTFFRTAAQFDSGPTKS